MAKTVAYSRNWKMGPLIARAFIWLLFGFFAADIINEFKFFDAPVKPYFTMAPAFLIFLIQEVLLRRFESKRKTKAEGESKESKLFYFYYSFVWLFVISLLIGIFLLWWGVIKKAIERGS